MKAKDLCSGGETEYAEQVFDQLDLKGAALLSKTFLSCLFKHCDLTGAELAFCRFRECRFESCNLSLVKPRASVFGGVVFRDSKLAGVNWTEAQWPKLDLDGPPRFQNCVLSDCSFLGLTLAGASFKACYAKEADFRDADLAGADFSGADLAGALFSRSNLAKANFSGARNYAINPAENKVKGAVFSLPEAMALLDGLGIKLT